MITIERIDHIVLTVRSIAATCAWYERVLGMEARPFGQRIALHFGDQKINLHEIAQEIPPTAAAPGPGTADLCLITGAPITTVIDHLRGCGVEVLQGPVRRAGALGPIESVYVRDPDGNLIEIARYGLE